MTYSEWIDKIGLAAAVILPLWNIPLILHIIQRKSSKDISLQWAAGVWTCIVLMAPSGFQSEEIVWKAFNIMNVVFFSMVFFTVLFYRRR